MQDKSGTPPRWFNSYWTYAEDRGFKGFVNKLRRKGPRDPIIAAFDSPDGLLDLRLPRGRYELEIYDQDFVQRKRILNLTGKPAEVQLDPVILPPGFIAKHLDKQPPEWTVTAARGVALDKSKLSDFRGKWLLVEFWGYW